MREGCYEYCESTRAATSQEFADLRDAYSGTECGNLWPSYLFFFLIGLSFFLVVRDMIREMIRYMRNEKP